MTVALALTASLVIGVSDFWGGRASERVHPALVTCYAQATALLVVPVIAVVVGWERVTGGDLLLGLGSGVLTGLAYLAFFSALGTWHMGVAAPLTAVVTATVPVMVDVARGVALGPGRWVGLAIALVSVPFLAYVPSQSHDRAGSRRASWLAVVAGLAFSAFFLLIGETSPDSGTWPLVANALGATVTVALVVAVLRIPPARPPGQAVGSGATAAVAGACLTAALQRGPVAVATVLGSLYPIVTVGLSAAVTGERVRWWHRLGLALGVTGAALVAVAD